MANLENVKLEDWYKMEERLLKAVSEKIEDKLKPIEGLPKRLNVVELSHSACNVDVQNRLAIIENLITEMKALKGRILTGTGRFAVKCAIVIMQATGFIAGGAYIGKHGAGKAFVDAIEAFLSLLTGH